jgi:hypothetical protein
MIKVILRDFGISYNLLESKGMDLPPETVRANRLKERTFSEETYRRMDEKGTIPPIGEMSQIPEQRVNQKMEAKEEALKKG